MNTEVTKKVEDDRFKLRVDGARVGVADYLRYGDRMLFIHTEVDQASDGCGLGGMLVRAALNVVRAQGLTAVPACSFVDDYITRNPEYADLRAR